MAEKEIRTANDGLRPYSALTHYIGVLISVAGFVLLEVFAALYASALHVVSFAIYGASLVALYTASTFYHIVAIPEKGRHVLRVIDHIMIYILIAGTYTPICLLGLKGGWGWSIFGVIWGCAIAGLVITLFFPNTPRRVSAIIYIVMGWLVVVAFWPLSQRVPLGGILWLLGGGICYTIGAICYAKKWPGRDCKYFGFHEVFHIFVILGSICHYMVMFVYMLNS